VLFRSEKQHIAPTLPAIKPLSEGERLQREKEIQIGTFRIAHENLTQIWNRESRAQELGILGLYYLEAASGQGGAVHSALDEFRRLETEEFEFWRNYVADFQGWVTRRKERGPTSATDAHSHRLGGFEASPDFMTVWLDGKEYKPTKPQAKALEFIFKAQVRGRSDVSYEDVLEHVESPSPQLRTVFRSRPEIWEEVLERPRKGMVRIRTNT